MNLLDVGIEDVFHSKIARPPQAYIKIIVEFKII
jgi:hypothetical protein